MCIIIFSIDQAKQDLSRARKTVHSNDKDVWPSIVNNYATIFGTKSAKYELENCIEITKNKELKHK